MKYTIERLIIFSNTSKSIKKTYFLEFTPCSSLYLHTTIKTDLCSKPKLLH